MTGLLHRALVAPPIAKTGDRLTLHLSSGNAVLDASGGAAVACLGHGDARVVEAMARQAGRVAYAHTGFFSSESAETLADMLVDHRPGGLSHAFFVSSGSEAMEAAIKLAYQYHRERGEPQRNQFVSRRQSYHGNTLGALSVSGHFARRSSYEPLLGGWAHRVSPCFPYHYQEPDENDAAYVARLAAELDEAIATLGSGRVAAFIAETVVGATAGCVTATPGYFAAIREICDRHGVLLILDEVMCGMGRTGTTHAWEVEGVVPDIQTIGKGLGGGYQPIAGILITARIVDALRTGSGAFVHGQTYQAHPVACAAAVEVQRIIREDGLLSNVRRAGVVLRETLERKLGDHPNVGDIRGRGLFIGIEFSADRENRSAFPSGSGFADLVKQEALALGLAIYPGSGTIDGVNGDHVLITPPYWIGDDAIELIGASMVQALEKALARV